MRLALSGLVVHVKARNGGKILEAERQRVSGKIYNQIEGDEENR